MLPLPFSNKGMDRPVKVLAADVGATKTNLALMKMDGRSVTMMKESQFSSQHYECITGITEKFLADQPQPEVFCIGVAGPVFNGKAKLTNLTWEMDERDIAQQMGLSNVSIINDLEATAYGLAMVTDNDIAVVHRGSERPSGNVAIIAPGTGLGEAGMYFDGHFFHPFATEGGHTDLASRDKNDFELYEYLQNKFGHVSNERVICGPGIVNIYQFLKGKNELSEPGWIADKIEQAGSPAIISKYIDQSALCDATMRLFIRFLAFESANLALKLKATGGLFIGGGIAPKLIPLFEKYQFNSYFISSGRMNHLLEKVPVSILLNTKTAMLGAAYFGSLR